MGMRVKLIMKNGTVISIPTEHGATHVIFVEYDDGEVSIFTAVSGDDAFRYAEIINNLGAEGATISIATRGLDGTVVQQNAVLFA